MQYNTRAAIEFLRKCILSLNIITTSNESAKRKTSSYLCPIPCF